MDAEPPAAAGPDVLDLLPPIVRDCLGPPWEGQRYDLSHPWRDEGLVWATDGRILCRVPEDCLEWHVLQAVPPRAVRPPDRPYPTGPAGRYQPRAMEVYESFSDVHPEPIRLPTGVVGRLPCADCRGTGSIDDDDGIPILDAHDRPYACTDCDGAGTVPDCDPIEVRPGHYLPAWLVAILARHGATVRACKADLPDPPVWFRAGDADGIAMPLSRATVERARDDRQQGAH